MSRIRFVSALAALAVLGACATATPYQAALDGQKGYANQQIESNRWQISFAGNSLTDRKTVETYLLYRAAELTDQEGYDYFQVIQRTCWAAFLTSTWPTKFPRAVIWALQTHSDHSSRRARLKDD